MRIANHDDFVRGVSPEEHGERIAANRAEFTYVCRIGGNEPEPSIPMHVQALDRIVLVKVKNERVTGQ